MLIPVLTKTMVCGISYMNLTHEWTYIQQQPYVKFSRWTLIYTFFAFLRLKIFVDNKLENFDFKMSVTKNLKWNWVSLIDNVLPLSKFKVSMYRSPMQSHIFTNLYNP